MDGIADIVGASEAGRILADDTPSGLASVIRELLLSPPSRAATRLYAEQFDWQSTTEGQIALFHEILERRPKARRAPPHAV
jgi:teichuronic acid biosynthesis glycosyltransferase TuaC